MRAARAPVSPVVPYKLHIVALVAFFDAVDTDGVPVGGVAGVTSGRRRKQLWSF